MTALLLVTLFVALPLVEVWVIWQVANALDGWLTLLILLLVSVCGAWIVRREGWRAWGRLQQTLAEGRLPGKELVDGALILVGGALLLTPGFVTDVVGLCCVLPPTRAALRALLRSRLRSRVAVVGPAGRPRPVGDDRVVDVEVLGIERSRREPDTGA